MNIVLSDAMVPDVQIALLRLLEELRQLLFEWVLSSSNNLTEVRLLLSPSIQQEVSS